jgi:hypothetical protein
MQCTRNEQAERWDLAQVEVELSKLEQVLNEPHWLPSADLVAEEVVALAVTGDIPRERIILKLNWSSSGLQNRKALLKWLPDAVRTASDLLKSHKWDVESANMSFGLGSHLVASIDVQEAFMNLRAAATTINAVAQRLTFK